MVKLAPLKWLYGNYIYDLYVFVIIPKAMAFLLQKKYILKSLCGQKDIIREREKICFFVTHSP